LRFFNINF